MPKVDDSILEMDMQITKIMQDLRIRIQQVYDKYTDENKKIPQLPSFDTLVKSNKLRYNTSKVLTESLDELISLKLRVSVVARNLEGMSTVQITSKSEYSVIATLKGNIKKYLEELSEYRFEISDLIKNANNKLRVLESVAFYNE